MPWHYHSLKIIYLLMLSWALFVPRGLTEPFDQEIESNKVTRPPNILFILLDDFGYNDLGINSGTEGLTPNLDLLAKEGVRFTRNYVDSTCAATRAGILTGQYPASLGFRAAGRGISPEIKTLPSLLQEAGYHTRHIGKWHLGFTNKEAWPLQQGYEEFFGFLDQSLLRGGRNKEGFKLRRPTYYNPVLQRNNEEPLKYQGHLNDLLLQEALTFFDDAASEKSPWFLNLWTYLPHTPLEPATRFEARFADTEEGRFQAMLVQVDAMIGSIKNKLDETGMLGSTVIIVAGDNGGISKHRDSNAPFAGAKMTFTEGGLRTPLLLRIPSPKFDNLVVDSVVSYLDYLPTIVSLAGVSSPENLPGRDFLPLLENRTIPEKALFWEMGESDRSSWSILSSDGRYRLSQNFGETLTLADFQLRREGIQIALTSQSDTEDAPLKALIDEFRAWHVRNRTLYDLTFQLDDSGVGQVSGQSLQRLMGFKGFAFGISVSQDKLQVPAERQIIANQPGYWSLSIERGELEIDVLGVKVKTRFPSGASCTTVVFSGYFHQKTAFFEDEKAELRLFIDGKQVGLTKIPEFQTAEGVGSGPTFLGRLSNGDSRFNGILGRPAFVNEYIVADHEANFFWSNGISDFLVPACSDSSGGAVK